MNEREDKMRERGKERRETVVKYKRAGRGRGRKRESKERWRWRSKREERGSEEQRDK